MAEKKLRCRILTPAETIFDGEVEMVVAPGQDGEIGILPLHIPLVSVLKVGELRLKLDENKWDYIAIDGGYVEISEDKVTVLADSAVFASKVDVARLEARKKEIEAKIANIKEQNEEFFAATGELENLANRLRVARRTK